MFCTAGDLKPGGAVDWALPEDATWEETVGKGGGRPCKVATDEDDSSCNGVIAVSTCVKLCRLSGEEAVSGESVTVSLVANVLNKDVILKLEPFDSAVVDGLSVVRAREVGKRTAVVSFTSTDVL